MDAAAPEKKSRLMFWMVLISIWLMLIIAAALFTMAREGSGDPRDPVRARATTIPIDIEAPASVTCTLGDRHVDVIRIAHGQEVVSAAITLGGTVQVIPPDGGAARPRDLALRLEARTGTSRIVGHAVEATLAGVAPNTPTQFEIGALTLHQDRLERSERLVLVIEPGSR